VAGEGATGIKITVWRNYWPERQLVCSKEESQIYFNTDERLQQDVFNWQVREDIWGGFTDETIRQELNLRFIQSFDPFLQPEARGFAKLKEMLAQLYTAAISNESSWSTSAQQFEEDNDGSTSVRLNALLAFCTQLRWIHDVFKDVPGASITVR
jgi:hypothetical protein